jgi:hypothetical protein
MMRKDSLKLLLLAGVVAFAILYGMELSSSGISHVYGPLEQTQSTVHHPVSGDGDWTLPPRRTGRDDTWEEVPAELPRNDRKPLVDRISGTAAETLHHLSSGGIRFVVSLFDGMTGS